MRIANISALEVKVAVAYLFAVSLLVWCVLQGLRRPPSPPVGPALNYASTPSVRAAGQTVPGQAPGQLWVYRMPFGRLAYAGLRSFGSLTATASVVVYRSADGDAIMALDARTGQGRVVIHIDSDDGRVGGSQDLKYLYACDMAGKQVWRFPVFSEASQADSPRSLGYVVPLDEVRTIVAQEGPSWTSRSVFYGLRAQDGRLLWRKTIPHEVMDMTALGRDVLILARRGQHRLLYRLNGATGTVRWQCPVTSGDQLAVAADRLYLLDRRHLYAYARQAFPGVSVRR